MDIINDPVVFMSITPDLDNLVKLALESDLLNEHDKQILSSDLEQNKLSPYCLTILKTIHSVPNVIFNACKDSKLIFLKKELMLKNNNATQNKEFLEHKAKLLRLDEERQYNQMVFGSPEGPTEQDNVKNQFSIITDQAAIGINMIVATLAAFGIGYYFAAYYNPNPSFCMAVGTTAATGMMIMEMILFIARASKLE